MGSQALRDESALGIAVQEEPPIPARIFRAPVSGQRQCPNCMDWYPPYYFTARLMDKGIVGPRICEDCKNELRVKRSPRRTPGSGQAT
jgi:hypothetical protein